MLLVLLVVPFWGQIGKYGYCFSSHPPTTLGGSAGQPAFNRIVDKRVRSFSVSPGSFTFTLLLWGGGWELRASTVGSNHNLKRWGKAHLGEHDMVRRVDRHGETLILVQQVFGSCAAPTGTRAATWTRKTMERCSTNLHTRGGKGS